MVIAYKVVQAIDDHYRSSSARNMAETHYYLNTPVSVPLWLENEGRYPLLFSEMWHAFDFINQIQRFHHNPLCILECHAEDEVDLKPRCAIHRLNTGELYDIYLEYPEGTVSYKKAIPLREIKYTIKKDVKND